MLKKRILLILGLLMVTSLAVFATTATGTGAGAAGSGFYESFVGFVTDKNVSMAIVLALFVMGFYRTVSGGTLMSIVFYWGLAFIFMNLSALTEAVVGATI